MERVVMVALCAWLAFTAFVVIGLIGKPRKPITHGIAVVNLLFVIAQMVGIAYLGGVLFQ